MIMRVLRYFTVIVLIALILVFAFIFGILFTDKGTSLVWSLVKDNVPMIRGEIESGNMAHGLNIRNFGLELDGLKLTIDRLDSSWDMLTLLYGRFDISSLDVDGITLNIDIPPAVTDADYDRFFYRKAAALWNNQDPSELDKKLEDDLLAAVEMNNLNNEAEKEKPWYIDIPLEINLKQTSVKNFLMDTDLFRLTSRQLDLSTHLYKHRLSDVRVTGDTIDFELKDLESPVYPVFPSLKINDGFDKEEVAKKIATLAPVFIPFEIEIKKLQLKNARYHQSSYDTMPLSADISGHILDYNIDLEKSSIDSEQYGKINIEGHVGLKDNLDLDLKADGVLDYTVTDDLRLNFPFTAAVKGDLTDLNAELATSDDREIKVKSRLNVLDGNLTNDSHIAFRHLSWPLNAKNPDHVLKDGRIDYRGTLTELDLRIDTGFSTVFLGRKPLKFSGAVDGTLEDINIHRLNLSAGAKDQLSLAAAVHYRDDLLSVKDLDFGIEGKISNILTENLVDGLAGRMHTDLNYDLHKNTIDFRFPEFSFLGTIMKYPINFTASLDGRIPLDDLMKIDVNIGKLAVDVYKNTIAAKGRISGIDRNDFRADIRLPNLNKLTELFLMQPIEGYLNAGLELTGDLLSPSLKVSAETDHLSMGEVFAINDLKFTVNEKADLTRADFSSFKNIKFDGLTLLKIKKSQIAGQEINNIILKAEGSHEAHKLIFWFEKTADQAFAFKETGSLKDGFYHAHFDQIEVNTPIGNWKQKQKLDLDYDFKKNLVTFSAFNLLNGEQSLVFKPGFYNAGDMSSDIHIQLKRFNLGYVNRFMPENTMIMALVNGTVNVTSKPNRPFVVDANIYSKNGTLIGIDDKSSFEKLDINFSLDEKMHASASVALNADEFGKLSAVSTLDINDQKALIGDSTVIKFENFDLGLFNPLLNDVETLKAVLNGEGVLKYDKPTGNIYLDGNFDLTEGQVVTQLDIANVENIHFNINSSRDAVTLDGGFNMGSGNGLIKGNIDLRPMYQAKPSAPKGDIALILDNASVNAMGFGTVVVDSNLKLSFKENEKDPSNLLTYLKGVVKIPRADIEIANVADSGESLSKDVEIVNEESEENEKVRKLPAAPENFFYDINISVGPYIKVAGFGLKSGFIGKMVVNNTANEDHSIDARGKISMVHGKFRSMGQSLIIRSGEVLFDGLVTNPSIKFEAIRDPETINDNSGVIVGVRVFGTPLKIDLKVFSEPELSDAEKLSYLLKGTALSEDASENSAAAASMLLGASLGSASNSLQDFTNSIGLKDFQLESTGSGDSSAVQASFYLTRNFKVSYGVGLFDSIMQLKLRYQLMKKLYLQYVNGVEQAVDLFYTFSFD